MIVTTGRRLHTSQWGRPTGSWCVRTEQSERVTLSRGAHLELRCNRWGAGGPVSLASKHYSFLLLKGLDSLSTERNSSIPKQRF